MSAYMQVSSDEIDAVASTLLNLNPLAIPQCNSIYHVLYTTTAKTCAHVYCLQHHSDCNCHARREIRPNETPLKSATSVSSEESTAPEEQPMQLNVGDWVAVIYGDKWHLGEVVGIREPISDIRYMVERGENRYTLISPESTVIRTYLYIRNDLLSHFQIQMASQRRSWC